MGKVVEVASAVRWHENQVQWYIKQKGKHPPLGWSLPRLDPAIRAADIPVEGGCGCMVDGERTQKETWSGHVRPFKSWSDEHKAQARGENTSQRQRDKEKQDKIAKSLGSIKVKT